MLRKTILSAFGFLLLGLMILVPTDMLRIGLSNFSDGDFMAITLEMESDLDNEDKEESKEKHKEKNKITVNPIDIIRGHFTINAQGSHTDKESFGHPLAHYLEVSTPPPEFI